MAFRPGNHDRAWNDPPVFAYQSTNAPPKVEEGGSRKTLLNKRVAFPMSTGNASTSNINGSPGTLPPILPPSLGSFPPTFLDGCHAANNMKNSVEELPGEESMNHLDKVSHILESSKQLMVSTEKIEDISKKLDMLYSNWKEKKLNGDIQQRLTKLCNCLEERDFASAETLQVALAVDYTAECSAWIVAIKCIITELKTKEG